MIPLETIEATALDLMSKAAIEIPDDYLEGVRRAAATEPGLREALERGAGAGHDRRRRARAVEPGRITLVLVAAVLDTGGDLDSDDHAFVLGTRLQIDF